MREEEERENEKESKLRDKEHSIRLKRQQSERMKSESIRKMKDERDRRGQEVMVKKGRDELEQAEWNFLSIEERNRRTEERKKQLEMEKLQALKDQKDELQRRMEKAKQKREEEERLRADRKRDDVLKRKSSERNLPSFRRTISDVGTRSYEVAKNDVLDELFAGYLSTLNLGSKDELLREGVHRVSTGNYVFGITKVQLKLVNNHLVARIGGGWLGIEEFIAKFMLGEQTSRNSSSNSTPSPGVSSATNSASNSRSSSRNSTAATLPKSFTVRSHGRSSMNFSPPTSEDPTSEEDDGNSHANV